MWETTIGRYDTITCRPRMVLKPLGHTEGAIYLGVTGTLRGERMEENTQELVDRIEKVERDLKHLSDTRSKLGFEWS